MKYIAIWLGVTAVLTLTSVVLYGGYLLVQNISATIGAVAVALIVVGIICVATIAAVVEYLTSNRTPETPEAEQ